MPGGGYYFLLPREIFILSSFLSTNFAAFYKKVNSILALYSPKIHYIKELLLPLLFLLLPCHEITNYCLGNKYPIFAHPLEIIISAMISVLKERDDFSFF